MNEEVKAIIVNGVQYKFWFDGRLNMWRINNNDLLIENHVINLEIDLANLGGVIDWNEIAEFIDYITVNGISIRENIKDAQFVLWSFFKTIYKNAFDDGFFQDIVFDLTGIDYKGANVNHEKGFRYDLFFFPEYIKDKNQDIGRSVYRANFRSQLLLGVYCDA